MLPPSVSLADYSVHASSTRPQAFHFDCINSSIPEDRLATTVHQLNNILPSDVRVYDFEEAPAATFVDALGQTKPWHAMFVARGKLYAYRIHVGAVADPLQRLNRFHEYRPVNTSLLLRAAACFQVVVKVRRGSLSVSLSLCLSRACALSLLLTRFLPHRAPTTLRPFPTALATR